MHALYLFLYKTEGMSSIQLSIYSILELYSGADPGFDQGGPQIVTGLKLPFWGLSFVEFWCWGLIFGGHGGPGPPGLPPGSTPDILLVIAEMPIYELTGNHTLSLSPLCL